MSPSQNDTPAAGIDTQRSMHMSKAVAHEPRGFRGQGPLCSSLVSDSHDRSCQRGGGIPQEPTRCQCGSFALLLIQMVLSLCEPSVCIQRSHAACVLPMCSLCARADIPCVCRVICADVSNRLRPYRCRSIQTNPRTNVSKFARCLLRYTRTTTCIHQSVLPFLITDCIRRNFLIIFLQRSEILSCLTELPFFHALPNIPMHKRSFAIHQIELMIQP